MEKRPYVKPEIEVEKVEPEALASVGLSVPGFLSSQDD